MEILVPLNKAVIIKEEYDSKINIGFRVICPEGYKVLIVEFDSTIAINLWSKVCGKYHHVTWIQDNIYEMVLFLISYSSRTKLRCCLFNKGQMGIFLSVHRRRSQNKRVISHKEICFTKSAEERTYI